MLAKKCGVRLSDDRSMSAESRLLFDLNVCFDFAFRMEHILVLTTICTYQLGPAFMPLMVMTFTMF